MNISFTLAVLLGTAFAGGMVAKALRFPLIVGYLLAGIVSSIIVTRLNIQPESIDSIAQIGVAFLMFTLGLEFSVKVFRNLGFSIILLSLLQMFLCTLLGILLFPLLGYDVYTSLFLGSVFSLSSTAVVVKLLSEKQEIFSLNGEIAIGWLLVQDIATLFLFILLPKLGLSLQSGSGNFWSLLTVFYSVSLSIGLISIVLVAGRIFIPKCIDFISTFKSREILLTAVVSVCLLSAVLSGRVGFSFALGAFLSGVIITSSYSKHAIFSEIRPMRDLFSIVFFVSLGFLIKLDFIFENIFFLLLLTVSVMAVKFLISSYITVIAGYHQKTAITVGTYLTSIGEFAFILGQLGKDQHLISDYSYYTLLSVTFLSLLLSSPLMIHANTVYKIARRLFDPKKVWGEVLYFFDQNVPPNEIALKNHVILLGHGRVGKYVTKALKSSGIPFVVIDFNFRVVEMLRRSGILAIYGDPSEIDILKSACIEDAKSLIIAIPDRQTQDLVIANGFALNPDIKIICRTHFEADIVKLNSMGIDFIVQPEFEAALTISKKLLKMFSKPDPEILTSLRQIQKDHGFRRAAEA